MREIIAAVGAAVFFIKGINAMTDQTTGKNIWFRMSRAVIWCAISSGAVLAVIYGASWVLRQILNMWQ